MSLAEIFVLWFALLSMFAAGVTIGVISTHRMRATPRMRVAPPPVVTRSEDQ
jgi:hypothetical protein